MSAATVLIRDLSANDQGKQSDQLVGLDTEAIGLGRNRQDGSVQGIGGERNCRTSRRRKIGNPQGLQNTVSDGLVSAVRDAGGVKQFQISVPISHGSSGGALINMRGQVIGITSSGIDQAQNLNFAIPINYVKEYLQQ